MSRKTTQPEERCPTCNAVTKVSQEEWACDHCGKLLGDDDVPLHGSILHQNHRHGENDHPIFCCWTCALAYLSKRKTDYFLSLPYLHYDDVPKGCHARDFWKAVRAFGKGKA